MRTCSCLPTLSEVPPFAQEAGLTPEPHGACALAWPVQASSSVVTSTAAADWRAASHEEFWLVTDGSATLGHAGQRFPFEGGTLFFFRRGETQGFWNRS